MMKRRNFLQAIVFGGVVATTRSFQTYAKGNGVGDSRSGTAPTSFELDEVTINELQDGMRSGKISARSLTKKYLERIDDVDKNGPAINSVIELNPDALAIADSLDRERKSKGARGPLHGIPILIKDNIDTSDRMMTTAGSLALLGSIASQDAFIVKKLHDAGAVILGKTNLSEWANF